MNWEQIRARLPNRWILLDVVKAHSDGNKRIPDELNFLAEFSDSMAAMKRYQLEHRQTPQRELLVLHTSRDAIEVEERRWVGIRG